MWFMMEKAQDSHAKAEQLLRTVNDAGSAKATNNPHMHNNFLLNISELVENGAELNRIHGNMLPLHCACFTGDVAAVNLLIRLGAMVNQADGYERRPLHYAAEQSSECVKALVDNGAHVDARDRHGNTPLHWAAYKNHPDSVRYLLDRGADPDALDHNQDSALSWAALKGSTQ